MRAAGTSGRAAVAVIAKEPVAGLAKTRLAAAVGPAAAAVAAGAMLADTVEMVAQVRAEPWLCFTPATARARMAALAPGFRLLPQAPGGLGERLAACAAALHGSGAARVAIVGADTPHLPTGWCERALALLDHQDVVLGPALDGGYYLVATTAPWPELFLGVPMGTDLVLGETLRRAAGLGLHVGLLPPLRDLDRATDLEAALEAGELEASPRTRAVAGALLEAPSTALVQERR